MEKNSRISHTTPKPNSKNKLINLFRAEIDYSQNEFSESYGDDRISLNSLGSSTVIGSSRAEPGAAKKKYECKWCFKVLANSQALGGHQNAHKKERLMNKKLQQQLLANQAPGFGYYIDSNYYYGSNDDDEFYSDEEDHVHGFSLTHMDGSSSTSTNHDYYSNGNLDLQLG